MQRLPQPDTAIIVSYCTHLGAILVAVSSNRAAVSIDQAKPVAPVSIDEAFKKKVDRCAYLMARYQENKPWLDELEALKTQVREKYVNQNSLTGFRCVGHSYYIDLTQKDKKRTITSPAKAFAALRKAIGIDKLLERLTITLKLIDEFIPAADQAAFVKEEHEGSRDLKAGVIFPKAA
jgi:hypothetical protein